MTTAASWRQQPRIRRTKGVPHRLRFRVSNLIGPENNTAPTVIKGPVNLWTLNLGCNDNANNPNPLNSCIQNEFVNVPVPVRRMMYDIMRSYHPVVDLRGFLELESMCPECSGGQTTDY